MLQASLQDVMVATQPSGLPTDVTSFVAWLRNYGDHFAGKASAQNEVMAELKDMQKMYVRVKEDQRDLAKQYTVLLQVRSSAGQRSAQLAQRLSMFSYGVHQEVL